VLGGSVFLFVSYLAFILQWTFTSGLGPADRRGPAAVVLECRRGCWPARTCGRLCDALGTEQWRRRITRRTPRTVPTGDLPFVSLHVPRHNEPPDMVIETLTSLLRLDYPSYEIIAIDDNSDDETLWRPVEQWCAGHGVKFVHLQDWPGYKSGALNYALRECTDPRAELIGVVDSDYQLDSSFLRRCAPLFADERIGFIQAPQDYRDWERAPYYRRLYYSYKYFFSVSQPSRNEHDGAIFAGTMGLIRRRALVEVGGWNEWCITEDAELSLRLLRGGWSGLHVDDSFGQGVMPLTFEALKSQRYRWCFGGIQILRMHWRSMVPGARTTANQLRPAQRWAYFAGAVQWYGDLLGLAFFLLLLVGAVNLASGGGELFRKLTAFVVATVPVLVALGLLRAIALLRRGTGASWRDAVGAFLIWQSTAPGRRSRVGAGAVRQASRVPPYAEDERAAAWWEAIRANWAETTLAVLGAAGIAAGLTRVDTQRAAAGRAAGVPDHRAGRGAGEQPRRAARHAAARSRRAAAHRVAAGSAGAWCGRRRHRGGDPRRHRDRRALLSTPSSAPVHPPRLIGPAQGKATPAGSTSPSGSPSGCPSPVRPRVAPGRARPAGRAGRPEPALRRNRPGRLRRRPRSRRAARRPRRRPRRDPRQLRWRGSTGVGRTIRPSSCRRGLPARRSRPAASSSVIGAGHVAARHQPQRHGRESHSSR
jgi:glycosyltransferase involved in cell wall biosynthesis